MSNRQKKPFKLAIPVVLSLFLLNAGVWSATVTVDFSKTHQTIDGFGGSSAWSGALKDGVMDALYKNGSDQIGLTILRLRIDPHGSWSDEKSNATKAKARGATVFATPWTPPESLKTNGNTVKGAIITSKYAGYVAWMKSFLNFCGTDNVDIVSIENEPDYAQQINYEGCTWTSQNFADFCKTYAPQIGKPIMMPESYHLDFSLSDPTLNDATAAANVTYIGGHLYGVSPKKYTKALDLKKHVWETEHYYTGDNANSCMSTAKEIFDCMNCDFSAYVWWWMTYSSDEGIYANNAPNHRGWVIGQFSKWVRPGYIRVDATYSPQNGVNVVAFKGDSNVVVAMNNTTSSQNVTFSYSNETVTSVTKYTSSQSKSGKNEGTITATNNSFSTTLDAQSVSTFVSAGSSTKVIKMYKGEDGKYGVENFGVHSDAVTPFIYLINGKRGSLPRNYDPRSISQGVYIMNGKINTNVGTKKILNASNK